MPFYVNSPNNPAQLALDGVPCYLFGTFNYHRSDTRMQVVYVALNANVATLTVQVLGGEIPLVGSFVTVSQTQTSSGIYNVNRVSLTAVSINATTGAGTISYGVTNANIGGVSDHGTAIAEVPEIPDAVPIASASASIACCFQQREDGGARTITVSLQLPTAAAGAIYYMQEAIRDRDAEYTSILQLQPDSTTALVTRSGSFYRVLISGATGTGTVIAKAV